MCRRTNGALGEVLFLRVPLVYAYSGSSRSGLDWMGWDGMLGRPNW